MTVDAILAEALSEVWSGADERDAAAVLDHLADRGYRVAPVAVRGEEPLPLEGLLR